jgi:hypothetical protein
VGGCGHCCGQGGVAGEGGVGWLSLWTWGSRAVVVVVGHLDKRKKKGKKNSPPFFLVSISGAVGTDAVGQVVGCVYGWWLGKDGGHCCRSGMWWWSLDLAGHGHDV